MAECCICQEKMSAEMSTTLHCGHVFHAKCLCDHFYINDNRCPLCRQGPRPSMNVEDVLQGDMNSSILTWNMAYKTVRAQSCNRKKDKRSKKANVLKQMCDTYKKWDVEVKKEKKAFNVARKKWTAIQKQVHENTKRKHADFLEDIEQTRKRLAIARSQWRGSMLRIMKKAREAGCV